MTGWLLASLAFAGDLRVEPALTVLPADAEPRAQVRAAGEALREGLTIELAGVAWTGPDLVALADSVPEEPFVRVVRESTQRAVDVPDLVRFLDDVVAQQSDLPDEVVVPAGRARSAGILVHPDDVFKGKPRTYGRKKRLAIDRPQPQESYPPAKDGDLLGPEWTMRFRNPSERLPMLVALHEAKPQGTFPSRLGSLVMQLEHAGAEVYITSTVRYRERGYLMWGAFLLSRADSEAALNERRALVEARNTEWGLDVPIVWAHPDGWEATKEAARRMADAYDVVYATEGGAKNSNHYGGSSMDFVALGLPRSLTLFAPDGAVETFDLSAPSSTRDLSLEPALIEWVEAHYGVRKLRSDYPHWSDAQ